MNLEPSNSSSTYDIFQLLHQRGSRRDLHKNEILLSRLSLRFKSQQGRWSCSGALNKWRSLCNL
uniref:Uncharacterized protein n=1 Tax=Physcomitrium patens TaxID=3218 RepID=A0A2K1JR29_PHYPA|nr:hypothetical protein PHYPA_016370 [Physcomitrium patens]